MSGQPVAIRLLAPPLHEFLPKDTEQLSILAKKYVTVALCGDGGDELFSGYTRYIFANNSFKYFTMGPNLVRHTLSRIIKMFPPEVLNSFG